MTMTPRTFVDAVLVIGTMVALAAGCSAYNDDRGKGDAPVGSTDDSPAAVINFPDGFANVARKCDGSTAIYTHTREAAPVVVPNSPECREGED
jgi:hypothetical protein